MATQPQFTPGPHSLVPAEHLGDTAFAVLASDGDFVAVGCLRGDAQLFAAAPELYEALSKIERRLFAFGGVQKNLDRHDVATMLDIVRDALAKARGEQVSA